MNKQRSTNHSTETKDWETITLALASRVHPFRNLQSRAWSNYPTHWATRALYDKWNRIWKFNRDEWKLLIYHGPTTNTHNKLLSIACIPKLSNQNKVYTKCMVLIGWLSFVSFSCIVRSIFVFRSCNWFVRFVLAYCKFTRSRICNNEL